MGVLATKSKARVVDVLAPKTNWMTYRIKAHEFCIFEIIVGVASTTVPKRIFLPGGTDKS
jgi:hypothetical protein